MLLKQEFQTLSTANEEMKELESVACQMDLNNDGRTSDKFSIKDDDSSTKQQVNL